MRFAIALIGSYLLGSIPTAYLVVKWLKRVDVRTVGSGNVGATNVTRAAGLWAGLAVFMLDLSKGFIAVRFIAPSLLQESSSTARLACGLCAVLGHVFPIFLGFKGGKGVATTIGVLVGAMPRVAGACLLVWIACFLLWRYVSVGSLAAAVMLPIGQLMSRQPVSDVLLGVSLACLIVAKHRANIERLREGREPRVGHQNEGGKSSQATLRRPD